MTELTEGRHAAEFILSESPGKRSRENVTLAASQTILPGTLLGKIAVGDSGGGTQTVEAATAFAGNTGTGTVDSLTGDAHTMDGDWKLVCIEPAANAGKFEVIKPDGVLDGVATVGVAYNSAAGLNFTISDATDFISGDGFTVHVSHADVATAGRYKAWDPAATDGSQNPVAISINAVTTGVSETKTIAVFARTGEVNGNCLDFTAAASDAPTIAAAKASLATVGIIVR